MANQKIAKVKLLPSQDNTSHIQVIYDNVKNIKVYLPTNSGNQAYRQSVLQDFIYMTQGYHVNEFESSREISSDTTQLFLSICQRSNVSGGAGNNSNNSMSNGSLNPSLNPSLNSVINSLVALSSGLNNNLSSSLSSDLATDGELFAELPRIQRVPPMENRMFRSGRQLNNPFPEIADLFYRISQNDRFPSDVRRVYTELHQSLLNPGNISGNHIRNLMADLLGVINNLPDNRTHINNSSNGISNNLSDNQTRSNLANSQSNNLSSNLANSAIPQPRNDMSFTDIISLFSNSLPPHIQSRSSPLINNSSLNSNSSPEIPIPEISIPTSIDDTDPPARFTVDERSHREVMETQALPPELSPHEETKELINLPHQTSIAPQRNNIQESTIKRLAANVKHILDTTSLRAPDFTNTTRSGYRKIKNFIKNITKVWLTQEEIDVFTKEMQLLNIQNTD